MIFISSIFLIHQKTKDSSMDINNADSSDTEELFDLSHTYSDEEKAQREWDFLIAQGQTDIISLDKIKNAVITPESFSEYEGNGKIIYVELLLEDNIAWDNESEQDIKNYLISAINCNEVIISLKE